MSKKLLSGLLAIIMIFCTFSCSKEEEKEKSSSQEGTILSEESNVSSEEKIKMPFEDFKNENLRILQSYTVEQREAAKERGHDNDIYYASDLFEEKYGGEVELLYSSWSELMTTCANLQASGEAPDLVWSSFNAYPRIAHNDVVMPIDEIDGFNPEHWDLDYGKPTEYKGKQYMLFPRDPSMPASGFVAKLTFNKSMCERNLVKTPDEFFTEGNWNWDTFYEVARATTQDINGDGTYDQWGFLIGNLVDLFSALNGSTMVKFTKTGLEANLTDPKVITAMDFVQKVYASPEQGGVTVYNEHGNNNTWFNQGKVCMIYEWNKVPADFKDEIGYAPYPVGPDNTENKLYTTMESWSVPYGSKNQESALAWVHFKETSPEMKAFVKEGFFNNYSEDQMDFANELWTKYADPEGDKRNYQFHTAYNVCYEDAYGVLSRLDQDLGVFNLPPASVAETRQSEIQGLLDKTYQ